MPGGHFEYDENEDHIFNLTEMPEHEYAPEPEFQEPNPRDHGEHQGFEPEPEPQSSPGVQQEPDYTTPMTEDDFRNAPDRGDRQTSTPGDVSILKAAAFKGDLSALHPLADHLQEQDDPAGFDMVDAMNTNHPEAARAIGFHSGNGLSPSQVGQRMTKIVGHVLSPQRWQALDFHADDFNYLVHEHWYVERAVARANEMVNQGDFAEASRMYEEASKVDDDLTYIAGLENRIRQAQMPLGERVQNLQIKTLRNLYDAVSKNAAMNRYLADRAARMAPYPGS